MEEGGARWRRKEERKWERDLGKDDEDGGQGRGGTMVIWRGIVTWL